MTDKSEPDAPLASFREMTWVVQLAYWFGATVVFVGCAAGLAKPDWFAAGIGLAGMVFSAVMLRRAMKKAA